MGRNDSIDKIGQLNTQGQAGQQQMASRVRWLVGLKCLKYLRGHANFRESSVGVVGGAQGE